MIPDQVAGYLERWPARVDPGAPVGQQGMQPVPFGVGLLRQPAQVDRQRLGPAHQGGERRPAERRVGIALRRRAFDVRDQPGVRGPRRGHGLRRGTAARSRGQPGRQAADAAEQRLRHRGADLVERLDGRVRDLRPGREVRGARGVPLLPRGVVAVVAGQVQLPEVGERVPAVQLEPGEGDPLQLLGGGQVRLVVRVRQRPRAGPRRLQPGQPRADPRGGQVLRLAVVLVPARELAGLGHVEVADGAHPRGKLHAGDAIRASCPGLPGRNGPA